MADRRQSVIWATARSQPCARRKPAHPAWVALVGSYGPPTAAAVIEAATGRPPRLGARGLGGDRGDQPQQPAGGGRRAHRAVPTSATSSELLGQRSSHGLARAELGDDPDGDPAPGTDFHRGAPAVTPTDQRRRCGARAGEPGPARRRPPAAPGL